MVSNSLREKLATKKKTADDNGCTVHFTNGSPAIRFRLVVGSDGIWSKVHTLVSMHLRTYNIWKCPLFKLTCTRQEYSGKLYIEREMSQDNRSGFVTRVRYS